MSKLSKAIRATITGHPARKDFNFTEVTAVWSDVGLPGDFYNKKFDIHAKFGASVILEDKINQTAEGNETRISNAVEDVRKAVIEEIFGEFRAPINELRVSLYQNDLKTVRNLLAKLELKMFYE